MMSKIYFLKGLPASGKSTRAMEFIKNNPAVKHINKDDIRAMLDNSVYSKTNEAFTIMVRNNLINLALDQEYSVIVDDTNYNPIHLQTIEKIGAYRNVKVEVVKFDTPLEECILRDSKREKPVGEKVIRDMYDQYLKPEIGEKKFEMDKSLPSCYIFDIDGTLAIMDGRSPYDYSKVLEDKVNHAVREIYHLCHQQNHPMIIVSGRPDSCAKDTEEWLVKNEIYYAQLYMRDEGDMRKDTVIKREFLDDIIKDYYVSAVFDDRDQVVKMRRNLGLTCFQVAEGNF